MKISEKPKQKNRITRKASVIIRKFYRRFIKIQDEPNKIALGFAFGLFVGMSPTLGIQTVIAVSLAALFRWNKISSALGVWISNPITAPFLYGITYLIGTKVLGIGGGPGSAEEIR